MENAIGYASYLVCQMEKEGGSTPKIHLGDNMRELKLYMESFPAGRQAIVQKKKEIQGKSWTTPSATAALNTCPPAKVAGLSIKIEYYIASSSVTITPQPCKEVEIGDDEHLAHV